MPEIKRVKKFIKDMLKEIFGLTPTLENKKMKLPSRTPKPPIEMGIIDIAKIKGTKIKK